MAWKNNLGDSDVVDFEPVYTPGKQLTDTRKPEKSNCPSASAMYVWNLRLELNMRL
jgi:hypothetical protein